MAPLFLIAIHCVLFISFCNGEAGKCEADGSILSDRNKNMACGDKDITFITTKSFRGNDPTRDYTLEIVECEKENVCLYLMDTWTNSNYFNLTQAQHRKGLFTTRQFVNLLQTAIGNDDEQISVNVQDDANNNDIKMTMHFKGKKKVEWDMEQFEISMRYKQLSFAEYVQKFEQVSLRLVQSENEQRKMKEEYDMILKTLQSKLEKLQSEHDKFRKELQNESKQMKQRLDGWNLQIVEATCSSGNQYAVGECTAQCPAGYKIVSGGCGTSTDWWHLRYSMKVDNGWKCRAREDHGSRAYRHVVNGYAYCIKNNPFK